MQEPIANPRWPGRRTEAGTLLIILIVAAFFRLYRLDTIPPGFTHDEAGHGHDAIAIMQGARPIYETVGYGREPLYDYIVAWLMPVFGPHALTLRLVSVLAGLLLIVIVHFWIRRAFDVPIALLTSAFLAVSFWAISTDRQALRSALLPTLFTASIYFLWQAVRPHARRMFRRPSLRASSWLAYTLAGIFLGLSFYTYLAARILPAIFVLLWFYLLIFHRSVWRQNWLGLIYMVALGVVMAVPMFNYIAAHPGIEYRFTLLSGPIDRLFAGDPSEIFHNTLSALGMFTVSGDNLWLYNIPGRPILDWPLAITFYLGVILSFIRFRKIEHALIIFWLLVAIFPSLLTGVTASSLRSIAAQPVVYLFASLGLIELVRRVDRVIDSHTLRSVPLVLLAIAVTGYAFHDYFDVWGQARDVRVAYYTTLSEVSRYLDRNPASRSDVAVSSIYPNRFHDPYAMQLMLHRNDLSIRWFTGSFVDMNGVSHASMIFPQVSPAAAGCGAVNQTVRCSSTVTSTAGVFTSSMPSAAVVGAGPPSAAAPDYTVNVIVQSIAPIDPLFADVFSRHSQKIDSVELRPDDFNPRFDVYQFDATAALSDALKSSSVPTGTLDFNHTVNLIGYDVHTPQVKPGATAEVITYWRIILVTDQELVLFTHALSGDPNHPVLAQQDLLDVPSYYWLPGDAFAQVHRFVIPTDTKPGTYPLEVGAYNPADAKRLSVFDRSGSIIGDHIVIGSITVTSP